MSSFNLFSRAGHVGITIRRTIEEAPGLLRVDFGSMEKERIDFAR
ncbi:hypothetical protein L195_g062547, partial [Trifolium pratense]